MKSFKMKAAFVGISMLLSFPLFGVVEDEPAILWRVSDGDSHIYLLGSVHLLRSSDYPLREIYQVAFDQVDGLAIEADITQEDSITDYVLDKAFYSSGTLNQDFSFSTIAAIRSWFRQNGFQFSSRYQPWFLATLIQEVEVLGEFTATGVDVHFLDQANNLGLPVEYLESWQVAIDYLTSMPPDLAEESILELINSSDDVIDSIDVLIDDWNQCDLVAMESYIDEDYAGGPENPLSISGRTLAWMPQVRGYLATNRKFLIIAGAGHMVGESGLPKLLESEGYTVERLPEAPWAELMQPELESNENVFRMEAMGAMGRVCIIETTTDFNDPSSWKTFDTITLTDEQTSVEIPYLPTEDKFFVRGRINIQP